MEFLPESRTEGILCWTAKMRGEKESWEGFKMGGGDKNAIDTGKSFVQVSESNAGI